MARFLLLGFLVVSMGCSGDRPPAKKQADAAGKPSAQVRIDYFYAGQPEVVRGAPVLLCYGVENAAQVRLEPPEESLTPGYHRCFQVTPQRTTTYRLTAVGKDGQSVSSEVSVAVKDPSPAPTAKAEPALIRFFLASASEVPAGFPVTLCYSAPEASAISIDPPVGEELKPSARYCFMVKLHQTTTYTLTARSAGGHTDSVQVTVRAR